MRDERLPGLRPGDEDDAALGARLDAALRSGLGREHVDVAQLLRRTRQASRRARVQRRAAMAMAAVTVAAVPVTYVLLEGERSVRGSSPASEGPASGRAVPGPGETSSQTPSQRPEGTSSEKAAPSPSSTSSGRGVRFPPFPPASRALAGPRDVLFPLPDGLAFEQGDLARPMVLLDDEGHYRYGPTAMGQECGANIPERRRPLTRRTWSWAEEDSNRLDQITVDLVVTGWNDSAAAFDSLVGNSGSCRFGQERTVAVRTPNHWVAFMKSEGLAVGVAAKRLPTDVILAVTVHHPGGTVEAAQEAERLVNVAFGRAVDAGLAE